MLITFPEDVLCIVHHPSEPQLCVSQVTGHLSCISYDPTNPFSHTTVWSTKRHKKACRALSYSPDGSSIVSIGADGIIKRAHSGTGKVQQKWTSPTHATDSLNAIAFVNDHIFCTGDDGGIIHAWDVQSASSTPIRTFTTHEDYISSFLPLDSKFILSTSGDGTLSVHDLRAPSGSSKSLVQRSDDQEDEITCCVALKSGAKREKVVVGTSSGILHIFNKGDWGDCNDRILAAPSDSQNRKKKGGKKNKSAGDEEVGVECIAKIDEHSVVVGGADGKVRELKVLPNRWVKIVGEFESGEPIEDVVVSERWVFAASGSHVRVWNLDEDVEEEKRKKEELRKKKEEEKKEEEIGSGGEESMSDSGSESGSEPDDEDDSEEGDVSLNSSKKRGKIDRAIDNVKKEEEDEEEEDEEGGDEDGDQFSSSSDEEDTPQRKKPKKSQPIIQKKKNTFFDDL